MPRGPKTVRGDFAVFVFDVALGVLLMGAALFFYAYATDTGPGPSQSVDEGWLR